MTVKNWRPAFLQTLKETGNVLLSCRVAGISRKQAYKTRQTNAAFAAEWADCMDDAIDMLEDIAVQRAKTVSDVLLIFLLKAHRPEVYRETVNLRIEHARIIEDTRRLAEERGLDPEAAVAEAKALLGVR